MARQQPAAGPEPSLVGGLKELAAAEAECTRCPLYREATQVVPGEGRKGAVLMLVGEQPGDREDLAGRPFVGPAGALLDRALDEAGIDRTEVFVTNAVKHFKFRQRGKRRLHSKPNAYEIERCRWWLDLERSLVRPRLVVALGATAARSLLGKTVTIGRLRGLLQPLDESTRDEGTRGEGTRLMVTIHPSALLRLRDEVERRSAYQRFVEDLELAREAVRSRNGAA